ncbi:hypothetical protein YC2023_023654 [Brassica napus]
MSRCGVKPRPHWITTEFGGKGAHHADGSQSSYERRPGVAERAEEARGGHYIKVDQLIPPKTTMSLFGLLSLVIVEVYFLLHQPISNPNVVYLKPPYMGSAQSLKSTKHTYIDNNSGARHLKQLKMVIPSLDQIWRPFLQLILMSFLLLLELLLHVRSVISFNFRDNQGSKQKTPKRAVERKSQADKYKDLTYLGIRKA